MSVRAARGRPEKDAWLRQPPPHSRGSSTNDDLMGGGVAEVSESRRRFVAGDRACEHYTKHGNAGAAAARAKAAATRTAITAKHADLVFGERSTADVARVIAAREMRDSGLCLPPDTLRRHVSEIRKLRKPHSTKK